MIYTLTVLQNHTYDINDQLLDIVWAIWVPLWLNQSQPEKLTLPMEVREFTKEKTNAWTIFSPKLHL